MLEDVDVDEDLRVRHSFIQENVLRKSNIFNFIELRVAFVQYQLG